MGVPEPRLVIFVNEQDIRNAQGFIIAEKQVLFEVDSFTLTDGLLSLIASYCVFYVSYPKSSPATGVLLFIQEVLLGQADITIVILVSSIPTRIIDINYQLPMFRLQCCSLLPYLVYLCKSQ